jgi:hypothetical protein
LGRLSRSGSGRLWTIKTLCLQAFTARSDALSDDSGSPLEVGEMVGRLATEKSFYATVFTRILFGRLYRCPHKCPFLWVAATGCRWIDITECHRSSKPTKVPSSRSQVEIHSTPLSSSSQTLSSRTIGADCDCRTRSVPRPRRYCSLARRDTAARSDRAPSWAYSRRREALCYMVAL